jgi:hypothetical protein
VLNLRVLRFVRDTPSESIFAGSLVRAIEFIRLRSQFAVGGAGGGRHGDDEPRDVGRSKAHTAARTVGAGGDPIVDQDHRFAAHR